ncbi:MAG: ABC transporter ATP-binding protein [Fibrobacter sp.]|nr:ABC transporter ATP-binding protein [Fibrobacter sp.]
MNAIQLDKVSFRYPVSSNWALSDVTLSIPEGSFFALLGPNGAGKTTMLRLLCGRFAAFTGSVEIAESLCGANGFLDPRFYGILLENPGVYPKLSIEEYVNYFAGFFGLDGSVIRERMAALSKSLELPALSTKMSALSLGNRQKVQILRAMIHRPKLLILDEPVANLDPAARESVWRLIADWRKQDGGTAIVCSHILAEMEQEATDFAIINRGCVLRAGAVSENLSNGSRNNKHFDLSFDQDVSEDQIRLALESAGLSNAIVKSRNSTLSDLYRETV